MSDEARSQIVGMDQLSAQYDLQDNADHPSGLADHPSGLADHPSGLADHPSGLADHPSGLADHPSGLADHPSGLADHPSGLADHRPSHYSDPAWVNHLQSSDGPNNEWPRRAGGTRPVEEPQSMTTPGSEPRRPPDASQTDPSRSANLDLPRAGDFPLAKPPPPPAYSWNDPSRSCRVDSSMDDPSRPPDYAVQSQRYHTAPSDDLSHDQQLSRYVYDDQQFDDRWESLGRRQYDPRVRDQRDQGPPERSWDDGGFDRRWEAMGQNKRAPDSREVSGPLSSREEPTDGGFSQYTNAPGKFRYDRPGDLFHAPDRPAASGGVSPIEREFRHGHPGNLSQAPGRSFLPDTRYVDQQSASGSQPDAFHNPAHYYSTRRPQHNPSLSSSYVVTQQPTGMGMPMVMNEGPPPSSALLAITAVISALSILCCLCTGIGALVVAIAAYGNRDEGKYRAARQKMCWSFLLSLTSLIICVAVIAFSLANMHDSV